jgi:mannose-1-phosphate guanylyltransferase
VANNDALLTLGMKPTRPETGYGYIQFGNGGDELRKVKTFTEKPNLEMAKVFLSSGEFAWNSGMFLWRADVIINQFNQHLPEVADKFEQGIDAYATDNEQTFINRIYPECPNISIDYGIMEKASNVSVQLCDFGWADLGTWVALHEASPKDQHKNVILNGHTVLYDCKDNMIAIPKGKLAVLQGLEDYLVADTENVLLICRKNDANTIRRYVNDVQIKLGEEFI